MARAVYYCPRCDTYFGGAPCYMSPDEHHEFAHDSNGEFYDYERVESVK